MAPTKSSSASKTSTPKAKSTTPKAKSTVTPPKGKSTPKAKSTTPKAKSAPSTPKKSRSSKSKSVAATETPVVEQAAAPAAPAAAAPAAPSNPWANIEQQFTELTARLAEFKTLYNSINSDVRALQKEVQRQMRESTRKTRRKQPALNPDGTKRGPSGFAKPTLISNELCSFLGQPEGTEMARTEVTKALTAYIKEHKLQDANNKRNIIPDAKLAGLLKTKPEDELTYFNLQKYMKIHFPKPSSAKEIAV